LKSERFTITGCCGRKSIIFKVDRPITLELLTFLVSNGYKESAHFTKQGMIYVNNSYLIVTGTIGTNRLQAKCQKDDCDKILTDFEDMLTNME
jgi:hypothetical protein